MGPSFVLYSKVNLNPLAGIYNSVAAAWSTEFGNGRWRCLHLFAGATFSTIFIRPPQRLRFGAGGAGGSSTTRLSRRSLLVTVNCFPILAGVAVAAALKSLMLPVDQATHQ